LLDELRYSLKVDFEPILLLALLLPTRCEQLLAQLPLLVLLDLVPLEVQTAHKLISFPWIVILKPQPE
jgi:hypothetical protein